MDRLLPKFVAVTNMPWGNTKLITKGNERVLAARLKDAQYFFQEDQKQTLSERIPALDGVMFHQKLGTMSSESGSGSNFERVDGHGARA